MKVLMYLRSTIILSLLFFFGTTPIGETTVGGWLTAEIAWLDRSLCISWSTNWCCWGVKCLLLSVIGSGRVWKGIGTPSFSQRSSMLLVVPIFFHCFQFLASDPGTSPAGWVTDSGSIDKFSLLRCLLGWLKHTMPQWHVFELPERVWKFPK